MREPERPPARHRESLGATVRTLRRARGLTLRELGDLIGVSAATLSGVENGKTGISSERVTQVAEALDVAVARLFEEASGERRAPLSRAIGSAPAATRWRDYPPLALDAALAGALASFLEFGYHGATMRAIAERAGLSVPGLYHYYVSKQDMLVALLDLTMGDLRERTDAARLEGRDAVERFTCIVECLALFHTHRRELAFVGASEMRSLEPATRARVAELRMSEQRVVDVAVAEGVREGLFETDHAHEAARAVVTMCTALAQWFRAGGPATAEQVAAQQVVFALDVVRCVRTPQPSR